MSSEQVIAAQLPEVFRERLADGWSFAYEQGTNYVGLNHPQGGKQSVLRIEYGAYADEIGAVLAAFLNLSTPAAGDVHSKPAISMQVRPDVSKESMDAIVEHLRTVREDHAADMIEQLQARNAEQALQLRFLLSERERTDAKLTALLDGIEGLEADLRARGRFRNDIADDMIVPMRLLDEINASGYAWKVRAEAAEAEVERLRAVADIAWDQRMTLVNAMHHAGFDLLTASAWSDSERAAIDAALATQTGEKG